MATIAFTTAALSGLALGQGPQTNPRPETRNDVERSTVAVVSNDSSVAASATPQSASSLDLVRRAVAANQEFAAARLDVERARARLRQAGLRPNPTIDFEQRTGRLTGAPGEGETTVGFALPLEVFGQRGRRVDLAEAQLEAAEAEIDDRERRLVADVRRLYAEALAASRDLRTLTELNAIDTKTADFVEIRVTEGESAPLELNLLRAEIDRTESRRAILAGRLEAALLELKAAAGVAANESVALVEDLAYVTWPETPATAAEAIEVALRTRPDLRLAKLEEVAAAAGLRLARAQAAPDVVAFSRFSVEKSVFDDTPVGVLRDRDRTIAFGVSIGLPIFNRNQGASAEAALAVAQARKRREFAETRVRAEVASAFARLKASEAAAATFERGVLARAEENIRSVRGAYQIGAYRITELLNEQRRLSDMQREFTETLAERYKAIADLQSAMGIAPSIAERRREVAPPVASTSAAAAYPGVDPAPATSPSGVTRGGKQLPVVESEESAPVEPQGRKRGAQPPQ